MPQGLAFGPLLCLLSEMSGTYTIFANDIGILYYGRAKKLL